MQPERRTAIVAELERAGVLLVEDGNHGEYRPRPDEFVEEGVAFIRAADMDAGRVLFDSASKINAKARRRITKGIGAPGDILLSHKGTVGKVALVPDDAPAFVCSPQTTFWRTLQPETLDGRYLYALLRSPSFHAQLATRAGETDMAPYVSLTSQRGLSVTLPPIEVQRAIASILGVLDDRIELNRRMAETLEAMARALFKSWFVDFEPVRAKAEGRPTGLPDDLAALLPDIFGDDELPVGWKRMPLRPKLARSVVRGLAPAYATSGILVLNQRCVRGAKVDLSNARRHDVRRRAVGEERLIEAGDIVINSTGVGTLGRVGQVRRLREPLTADSHVTIVKPNTSNVSDNILGMSLLDLEPAIETLGHGSTGQTELSREFVNALQIVVPDELVQNAFDRITVPLRDRADAALEEAETFAQLRDTLLPKLISGELRIADAEKQIVAA